MKKILVMIALMLPIAVMAQEKKKESFAIPQSETTIRMAAELSKFGYANKDALALIQAARLSKQLGLTVEQKEKAEEGAAVGESGQKSGKVSLDVATLLADAKGIAGEDGVLLALIDDVNNNVRGAVGGSKYARDRVNAGATDVYRVQFRANEMAMVTVIGDGDTDLDLYIYDENDNLIDSDEEIDDNCVCIWTPKWTGTFKIKIVNRGRVYNNYVLHTN